MYSEVVAVFKNSVVNRVFSGPLTPFKDFGYSGLRVARGWPNVQGETGLARNKKKIHYTLNVAGKWIRSLNNAAEMSTSTQEKNENRTQ